MFKVLVEERTDETSGGTHVLDECDSLGQAQRVAVAGRIAYPDGAAWVEDEQGNVIPA